MDGKRRCDTHIKGNVTQLQKAWNNPFAALRDLEGSGGTWRQSCSVRAKLLQWYLILCNPMDCRLPGSSVPGILQARILEQVAMPSSVMLSEVNQSEKDKHDIVYMWNL